MSKLKDSPIQKANELQGDKSLVKVVSTHYYIYLVTNPINSRETRHAYLVRANELQRDKACLPGHSANELQRDKACLPGQSQLINSSKTRPAYLVRAN